MKKQNVNNKLAFNKAAVTELNQDNLDEINGGTCTRGDGKKNLSGNICDLLSIVIQ